MYLCARDITNKRYNILYLDIIIQINVTTYMCIIQINGTTYIFR